MCVHKYTRSIVV